MTTTTRNVSSRGSPDSMQDLKLDKIQQFVLDECDKCLDKVDMRKDQPQAGEEKPLAWLGLLAGRPADFHGNSQEEAGNGRERGMLSPLTFAIACSRECQLNASNLLRFCGSQVMMFSATMTAETRALCKKFMQDQAYAA